MKVRIEKIGMGTKPDPYKYAVLRKEFVNGNTIILARYAGCLTFNGEKLMVLKGTHQTFETLDPHFFEDHPVIARFIPDSLGWRLARLCARHIHFDGKNNTEKPTHGAP